MTDEKVLMEGDFNQIILTTHRIRQENKSWGQVNIISIMLEDVTSCEYHKNSKPFVLIIGLLVSGFGMFIGSKGGDNSENISIALLSFGFLLIIIYLFSFKRGLFISSAAAKIKLNTKGMEDENIQSFIDKLEAAKNDRFLGIKIEKE